MKKLLNIAEYTCPVYDDIDVIDGVAFTYLELYNKVLLIFGSSDLSLQLHAPLPVSELFVYPIYERTPNGVGKSARISESIDLANFIGLPMRSDAWNSYLRCLAANRPLRIYFLKNDA